MFNTSPVIVEKIRSLSQDEGLKDSEIAEIINYNRVSVQRIRKQYNIPTYNPDNRKDKAVMCPQCNQAYYIRRNQSPMICCPKCQEEANKKIAELYKIGG
jgi:ribosomal protein L37AE/L43A